MGEAGLGSSGAEEVHLDMNLIMCLLDIHVEMPSKQ